MLFPFVSSRVAARHRDDLHAGTERSRLTGLTRVSRCVSIQMETPMEIEMLTIHRSRTASIERWTDAERSRARVTP